MNCRRAPCIFSRRRIGPAILLLTLAAWIRAGAAIAHGPEPKNAVEKQQQNKLAFDQAILSGQEKLRVGQERFERQEKARAQVVQGMMANLQARQKTVALQPASPAGDHSLHPKTWLKPALTAGLVVVVLVCFRFLHTSRKRELADSEGEKRF